MQPVYNRLLNAYRRRELERPGSATHAYYREQARAIVDELEARGRHEFSLPFPDLRRPFPGPLGTPASGVGARTVGASAGPSGGRR